MAKLWAEVLMKKFCRTAPFTGRCGRTTLALRKEIQKMFEMIRRIFKIAGNSRGKIVAGIFCNILKSFFNGFMMFGVFWITPS